MSEPKAKKQTKPLVYVTLAGLFAAAAAGAAMFDHQSSNPRLPWPQKGPSITEAELLRQPGVVRYAQGLIFRLVGNELQQVNKTQAGLESQSQITYNLQTRELRETMSFPNGRSNTRTTFASDLPVSLAIQYQTLACRANRTRVENTPNQQAIKRGFQVDHCPSFMHMPIPYTLRQSPYVR